MLFPTWLDDLPDRIVGFDAVKQRTWILKEPGGAYLRVDQNTQSLLDDHGILLSDARGLATL